MAVLLPTSGGRVRVFFRRKLRFDLLDFDRQRMFRIGNFGLAEVRRRIDRAVGPEDGKVKPLSKSYAVRKSRAGLGNTRNLRGFGKGGNMLDNLKVRTVALNEVRAFFSLQRNRDKAAGNERREPFLVFSPRNVRRIAELTDRVFKREIVPNVVKTIGK
jgi:hypothetical protein